MGQSNGEIKYDEAENTRVQGHVNRVASELASNQHLQDLSLHGNRFLPGSAQAAVNLKNAVQNLMTKAFEEVRKITSTTLPDIGDGLDRTKQKFQQNEQNNSDQVTSHQQNLDQR
ncbi:hypothetical protein ABT337_25475 [Saccharopolyspora hirsuta]|uniref:Uncharacterized protein n=1 Tax=Saccharopolyspora hirsuta TaxID=1837 RepID=A0A5M7BLV3_SACHI|nr:hypothetical protein [Saccharopolyspora hirsuta]KAA5829167.1 hypothetical protein F1721_26230 [Saccharopolyspora hirsuta]